MNHLKNVLVVRGELVTGVQVQFWIPILTHSKSSSQTFMAMDDSRSRGCWPGRKEEDSPSLAFLLNHLPLCATNNRSPNLLQNFLKVARSYCSKKLLLKIKSEWRQFFLFLQDKKLMSMVKYYIMQFKNHCVLYFFKLICGRWRFNRGKPNNLSLPCNNVFLVVFLLTIVWNTDLFFRMKQSLSFCVVLIILIGNTVNHPWNIQKHCSQRKIEAAYIYVYKKQ